MTWEEKDAMEARRQEIIGIAKQDGVNYIFDRFIDNDMTWEGLNYPEFCQALSNANDPAIPAYETEAETEAFFDGAWEEYLVKYRQEDF